MKIWTSLKEWWNRPPARDRVLAALSETEWRHGIAVWKAAKVNMGSFCAVLMPTLEQQGLVESRFETRRVAGEAVAGPVSLHRRILYRRLAAGTALLRVKK